ncbi:MAG: response regulator, partial [Candidatus Binatia bacterium]
MAQLVLTYLTRMVFQRSSAYGTQALGRDTTMMKKRILLIDDEPSFTRVLKLYLEKSGAYEVTEENRGEMALETARRFKPDLILLDVM